MKKKPKEEIKKLRIELHNQFDNITKQIILLKERRNQFKGGIIACDILLQKPKKKT